MTMQQLLPQQQQSFRHFRLMQPLRQLQRQHRSRSCLKAQSTHPPCRPKSIAMLLLQAASLFAVTDLSPTSLVLLLKEPHYMCTVCLPSCLSGLTQR